MLWIHLPIVDVSITDERFEEQLDVAGEKLRSILRRRLDVLGPLPWRMLPGRLLSQYRHLRTASIARAKTRPAKRDCAIM